jgi:hypothetical protein
MAEGLLTFTSAEAFNLRVVRKKTIKNKESVE